MAVQACLKPNILDEMDDDDSPIVFKRSSSTSKQKQLNLEAKMTSQRKDGSSGKQVSGSATVQNSVPQKVKTVPSPKTSQVRSTLSNSSAAPSSSKASPVKSPLSNLKKLSSLYEQSKHMPKDKMIVSKEEKKSSKDITKSNYYSEDSEDEKPLGSRLSKEKIILKEEKIENKDTAKPTSYSEDSEEEKPLSYRLSKEVLIVRKEEKIQTKDTCKLNNYSDDSEDDKPLSYRLSAVSSKGNLNHANQGVSPSTSALSSLQKPKIIVKNSFGDSDDDRPLSSRFLMKSDGGISATKPYDSGTKPLSKPKQNGSTTSRDDQIKSLSLLSKRPLDKVNSSIQSSVKKPKLSDASQSLNTKSPSMKSESEDEEEYIPLAERMKNSNRSDSKSSLGKHKVCKIVSSIKKTTFKTKKVDKNLKYTKFVKMSPSSGEGKKWTTLVHNGVIFPPPYKPHGVKMLYKGKQVDLTPEQEEVATMFAVMMETDYARKEVFLTNFMNDWRKILGKNHVIQKIEDCDFTPIYEWHQREKEKKKLISTEEKKALKEEKMNQEEKYMWATVDGVKEKVGNFRVEPPGLFRGRGEHPKMGKLKKRISPSDITINIGKGAPIPECPIIGERWKEVRHDNTVTWLAYWIDPINSKEFKYVFLAASSSLKGQSDKEKYEKARTLKDYIQGIRASYTKDFVSKDITKQQIAVATYLIDKLALRAGNEKDDDEADTVGCCTLKVENVKLIPPNKLEFDFLGKDSIRYNNVVEVELPVYKSIGQFQKGKSGGDDLFDKLDTSKLNIHLKTLMPGLTAKVFRTYNASITLDEMLTRDTKGGEVAEKIVVYNHANKEVAIICNHQRTVSKSHASQISKLNEKISELKSLMDELQTDLARAKKGKPLLKDKDGNQKKNLTPEVLERKMAQTNAKIEKMERDKNTKEDLKTVALGTSKINYLDPRISVAWCKRHEVAIEKIFNKSLLAKFAWAMDVDPDFRF